MLRNKIGKLGQTTSNNESGKATEIKGQSTLNSGIKVPSGIGQSIGGIKAPSLIGVKPLVKPITTGINLPTTASQKQPNIPPKQTSIPLEQKPQPIRAQQIKTQQQRLAELVNKRAAQMKKQHQMINKISSQVGCEKKSYFKEYQTSYGHVLNVLNKKIIHKNKENSKNISKQQTQNGENKKQNNIHEPVIFKVNAWDEKNLLKQYLSDNFKKENYL